MVRALYEPEFLDLDDFEEYVLNKPADEKWELINGRVVRGMVGARLTHHLVVRNVSLALDNHIRSRGLPCRTFTETFWLKQRFQKLAAFPDIMVRCGPVEADLASLEDPIILIEVVSPTSRGRDRGEKARAYMRLPSARHVVFIDRDRVLIDGFDRSGDAWLPRDPIESIDATFNLEALAFSLPVAEVYRDVLPAA
jgi:Uma2 family endonuclease